MTSAGLFPPSPLALLPAAAEGCGTAWTVEPTPVMANSTRVLGEQSGPFSRQKVEDKAQPTQFPLPSSRSSLSYEGEVTVLAKLKEGGIMVPSCVW